MIKKYRSFKSVVSCTMVHCPNSPSLLKHKSYVLNHYRCRVATCQHQLQSSVNHVSSSMSGSKDFSKSEPSISGGTIYWTLWIQTAEDKAVTTKPCCPLCMLFFCQACLELSHVQKNNLVFWLTSCQMKHSMAEGVCPDSFDLLIRQSGDEGCDQTDPYSRCFTERNRQD